MSNIGKTIWSREHKSKGIVTNESYRNCTCCGYSPCLIVKWDDGKKLSLVLLVSNVFLMAIWKLCNR